MHQMKKALVFSALMGFVAVSMISCKSHELCPAYGKSENGSDTKKETRAQAQAQPGAPNKTQQKLENVANE